MENDGHLIFLQTNIIDFDHINTNANTKGQKKMPYEGRNENKTEVRISKFRGQKEWLTKSYNK